MWSVAAVETCFAFIMACRQGWVLLGHAHSEQQRWPSARPSLSCFYQAARVASGCSTGLLCPRPSAHVSIKQWRVGGWNREII